MEETILTAGTRSGEDEEADAAKGSQTSIPESGCKIFVLPAMFLMPFIDKT